MATCEIYDKLSHARDSGLQWPKIRLSSYIFSLPKYSNTVYVKHTDGTYLGKILHLKFYPASPWITTAKMQNEISFIIFSNLSESLQAYGQQTGNCGCCGRKLTAAESVNRMIGPICAEKFGF